MEFLAACSSATDDVSAVAAFLGASSTHVTYAHPLNGWTGLHWASSRNHLLTARLLLDHGADASFPNAKGATPRDVATSKEMRALLGGDPVSELPRASSSSFTPNYLVDVAALPPLDKIMAGAAAGDNDDQRVKHALPEYIPSQSSETPALAPSAKSAHSQPSPAPPIDLSTLQEVLVHVGSRYDTNDRSIAGAIHVSKHATILEMVNQAYSELDIMTAPTSETKERNLVVSRLDNSSRVIPVSKKQHGHLALMHYKEGNGLIVHDH
ncbi:hypothetical protein HDU98_000535 [Podochytrium sp. JEL0797]|nr:hypothetical protein HDU98_000535 [Podochytrium sp. JEL0797]